MKSLLELQREITLIELSPSPYFFIKSICLVDMNMFARFVEIQTLTLQDIKETKHDRRTDVKTVYPHKSSLQGYKEIYYPTIYIRSNCLFFAMS